VSYYLHLPKAAVSLSSKTERTSNKHRTKAEHKSAGLCPIMLFNRLISARSQGVRSVRAFLTIARPGTMSDDNESSTLSMAINACIQNLHIGNE
jgi:hypothetical protein